MTNYVTTPTTLSAILNGESRKKAIGGKNTTQCACCRHAGFYKIALKGKPVRLPYCASPDGCVEE